MEFVLAVFAKRDEIREFERAALFDWLFGDCTEGLWFVGGVTIGAAPVVTPDHELLAGIPVGWPVSVKVAGIGKLRVNSRASHQLKFRLSRYSI